jgi:N-acylneuraminate cytidylyltransferase
MITYPIEAARQSGLFHDIIVSTEDAEIAAIAASAGASVAERPADLAHDRATVVQVCLHLLASLGMDGCSPDYFCCIYPTALMVRDADLVASHRLLHDPPGADSVMGVSEYNLQPVQALVQDNGFLKTMWPEYHAVQSQFQPDLVASNGMFYWARTGPFSNAASFYMERLKGFRIPWYRAVDIDTAQDFKLAELIADNIHLLEAGICT